MVDLNKVPIFRGLGENDLNIIRAKAVERVYAKGSTIFVEGQQTDGFYIISSGLVKVLKRFKDGREKILTILRQGDILGEMTILGSDLRSASAEAVGLTNIIVIPYSDLRSLLMEVPALALKLIEILSDRLREADSQIQELAFLDSRGRVICNLAHLAERHGRKVGSEVRISLRVTHAELAKMASVSRETVTKILLELQDEGMLTVTDRQLQVPSPDRLYQCVM